MARWVEVTHLLWSGTVEVGSVRIKARGPSNGRMLIHRLIRASLSVPWRSLGRGLVLCRK